MTTRAKIVRWLRSSLQRTFEWQFHPLYWAAHRRLARARFWFACRVFGAGQWSRLRREDALLFFSVLRVVLGQVVLAVVLVAGLEAIERVLTLYEPTFAQGRPALQTLGRAAAALSLLRAQSVAHTGVLVALAQVAGVFLGLYFTAVGVVASTRYANVTVDVRALLMREKVGNLYIRVVALLAAVAVLLLAESALGFQPAALNLIVVGLLGVIAVFSFVPLGFGVFQFLEPTKLVRYLHDDLRRLIRSATPKGYGWLHAAFQKHFQRQAEETLATYRNLVGVAARVDPPEGRLLAELACGALQLQRQYARHKPQIPSQSFWFRRVHRHPGWLTAHYSQVDIALQTGTPLDPKPVPDSMWLEREVEHIVVTATERILQAGDLQSALSVVGDIQRTLYILGERLAMDEALLLVRVARGLAHGAAHSVGGDGIAGEDEAERLSSSLALVDLYGLGLINIVLGMSAGFEVPAAERLTSAITAVKWHRPGSLYATRLPRHVVERLEMIAESLEFERAVEGRAISPPWYLQQVAAQAYARLISASVSRLTEDMLGSFSNEAESLVREKKYVFAAELIQRGLKACDKLDFHLGRFKGSFVSLEDLRKVADIPWPNVDWDATGQSVKQARERLILRLRAATPAIARLPQSERTPDYFGHAYSVLAEASHEAMASGNDLLFRKVFPAFFVLAISAPTRVLSQVATDDDRTRGIFGSEPLADLFELSGLAMIYTDLAEKGYWPTAKRAWDVYLSGCDDAALTVKLFMSAANFRRSQFTLMPRAVLRTKWKLALERRLESDGLVGETEHFDGGSGDRAACPHDSPIIRALVGTGRHLVFDGEDVFLAAYLAERPEAAGQVLPHNAKLFAKLLTQQQRTDTQGVDRE